MHNHRTNSNNNKQQQQQQQYLQDLFSISLDGKGEVERVVDASKRR